jgi:hypothetical protein
MSFGELIPYALVLLIVGIACGFINTLASSGSRDLPTDVNDARFTCAGSEFHKSIAGAFWLAHGAKNLSQPR